MAETIFYFSYRKTEELQKHADELKKSNHRIWF